jgi:hypothetical protein
MFKGKGARSKGQKIRGKGLGLIGFAVFVFILVVEHGEVRLISTLGDVVVFYCLADGTTGFVGMCTVRETALLGKLEDFLEIAGKFLSFHIESSKALDARSVYEIRRGKGKGARGRR